MFAKKDLFVSRDGCEEKMTESEKIKESDKMKESEKSDKKKRRTLAKTRTRSEFSTVPRNSQLSLATKFTMKHKKDCEADLCEC